MRVSFGDCVFDAGTRQVFRAGRLAPISPKAFQLLQILIDRHPNAVSKEELHQLLWPDTFVSDANLPNLVAELRAELGDDPRSSQIIRTVQRFGYAFAATPLSASPSGGVVTASGAERPASGAHCRLIWGIREIALCEGENLLGRDPEAAVWIDSGKVSRRHARILVSGGAATLEDLHSKNGTYLQGRRIQSTTPLATGDTIRIGPASLIFRVFSGMASTETEVSP
jgi:DNA-binding winged helix-turn-helix (wHTH) protein